jgi:redox-sensitive bicupin YhaK (pirin superfamily)
MVKIRKSSDRGHANHGWLDTYHTFSFADYYDPKHMGFSVLRVINEDEIAGAAGFPTHAHKDMEIITYIVEGALEHKDSMGTTAVIKPGEVQKMTAGTGVTHSEYNHHKDQKTHLIQIWIIPDKQGYPPSYDQKTYLAQLACSDLVLVASHTGKENTIKVQQDVDIYVGKSASGAGINQKINRNRNAWIQIVKGEMVVNGSPAKAGDGVALSEEENINIVPAKGAEFILFDLP